MNRTSAPPTRPSLNSITILVAGCITGFVLRVLGVHIADSVEDPNNLTVDDVTALNLCQAGAVTLPLCALAVFAMVQPIDYVRRVVGVLAPVGVSLLASISILSAWNYGITDYFFLSALQATLITTAAVLAWVLVRRRSLATLCTVVAALIGGFLFHLGIAHAIIFSSNLTDLAAVILGELILLMSVVLLAWLAVGIDALAEPGLVGAQANPGPAPVGYPGSARVGYGAELPPFDRVDPNAQQPQYYEDDRRS